MTLPAFVWLIACPLVAAPLVYFVGHHTANPARQMTPAYGLVLAALGLSWLAFIRTGGQTSAYTLGMVTLRFDELSGLFAALALGLGTVVLLFSGPDLHDQPHAEKYYALLLAALGLLCGLATATDFFNLWVWFEALTVACCFLVAFYQQQAAALEAGFKYLVQSAVGASLSLLGCALLLAQTGSLDLTTPNPANSPLLLAAGALVICGFGVKAALVPLHTWLPDAHSQAPSGISALLSGVILQAGLVAMLRALLPWVAFYPVWGAVFLGAGALNLLYGNLLALRQTQVKRLLAYSSLSHMGYMLLGLGLTFATGQPTGAQGTALQLLAHGLLKGLAFCAAGTLLFGVSRAHQQHQPLTLAHLAGAAQRYPWAALALSLAVLGLGGLPPLAVFAAKWQIFSAGLGAPPSGVLAGLVVFAALNSVLSLTYYMPVVNALYRQTTAPEVTHGAPVPRAFYLPLTLLAMAGLFLGVWPAALTWLTAPAGQLVAAWWQP